MTKIVFMGTPEFAVPALEAACQTGDVVAVYTQPDRPVGRGLEMKPSAVKVKALELGIQVCQPEKLSTPEEINRLREFHPDLIVVVAYGHILKQSVLNLPRLGCVNIHSSLLPRWRGAAPIQWAILSGDEVSGVTTMEMVEKLDAGGIYLQESTPIHGDDTTVTLHDRLAEIGARLLAKTIEGLSSGTLRGIPQDESQVTYAKKLTKEMEFLDPAKTAEELDRQIRGLNPWPGTLVQLKDGQSLKIKKARLRKEISAQSGTLFERSGMVLLGTSEGSLQLDRVQWAGKKEMNISEFLNGLRGRGVSLPLELRSSK